MQAEQPVAPERLIGGAQQRQVQLPLTKAFQIAVRSIRVRFWRSMITAAGVLLGIAFLSSTLGQATLDRHTVVQRAVLDRDIEDAQQREKDARQVWLVTMSLVVCTVGIANSMLMSVTERFKEIGTMKCLGALDSFIVKLFLLEAGVLGVTASVIGFCIGFVFVILGGLVRDGGKVWSRLPLPEVGTIFAWCLLAGMALTILATIFPAIRASKLPPAAALRIEV